jgi:hypothetical protein
VRTRAPFVRGWLVARRRPKKCQEVVVWISIPFDRIRGLDASPGGIPTTTFSFGLEYVLGCLESVARALGHVRAHPGTSLTLLLEGSCRTPFEGQLSLPRDLLRVSHPFKTYLEIFRCPGAFFREARMARYRRMVTAWGAATCSVPARYKETVRRAVLSRETAPYFSRGRWASVRAYKAKALGSSFPTDYLHPCNPLP